MQKISVGSPILEFLKLDHCTGENTFSKRENIVSKLSISSSSLIELGVENVGGNMEISAPNLRSLSLLGEIHCGRLKLINDLSSPEEVYLSLATNRFYGNWVNEFLTKIFHAQKSTTGNWFLQVLSIMELQHSSPSLLSKCTSLTLKMRINERHLPGFTSLLQSSPDHLGKLTIINTISFTSTEVKLDFSSFLVDEEQYWASTHRYFKRLSCRLRSVKIMGLGQTTGFGLVGKNPISSNLKSFCSLVEFLLKNFKVLENMVINAESDEFPEPWTLTI